MGVQGAYTCCAAVKVWMHLWVCSAWLGQARCLTGHVTILYFQKDEEKKFAEARYGQVYRLSYMNKPKHFQEDQNRPALVSHCDPGLGIWDVDVYAKTI